MGILINIVKWSSLEDLPRKTLIMWTTTSWIICIITPTTQGGVTTQISPIWTTILNKLWDHRVSKKAIPTDPKKSNLELLMEKFAMMQTRENYEFRNQNLLTNETLRKLTTNVNNVATHNQMLETQIS